MRRSNRNSGTSTPAEPTGPTFTASGRQVRSRHGGAYGESMLSGRADASETRSNGAMEVAEGDDEELPVSRGRARRTTQQNGARSKPQPRKHIEGYNSLDSMDDESDAASSGGWDGGDDDESEDHVEDDEEDEDVEMSDAEENDSEGEDDNAHRSLVVSLRYLKSQLPPPKDISDANVSKDSSPRASTPMDPSNNSHGPQSTFSDNSRTMTTGSSIHDGHSMLLATTGTLSQGAHIGSRLIPPSSDTRPASRDAQPVEASLNSTNPVPSCKQDVENASRPSIQTSAGQNKVSMPYQASSLGN